MSEGDQNVPPVGEEIHLPGPTALPLVVAIGLTLVVVGSTINLLISVVGLIIFLIATGMWIRDTRRDIEDLPEDHGHS